MKQWRGRERSPLLWGMWRFGRGFEGGEDLGRGAIGDAAGGLLGAVGRGAGVRLPGLAAGADVGVFFSGASEFGEELFGEAAVAGSGIVRDELV